MTDTLMTMIRTESELFLFIQWPEHVISTFVLDSLARILFISYWMKLRTELVIETRMPQTDKLLGQSGNTVLEMSRHVVKCVHLLRTSTSEMLNSL